MKTELTDNEKQATFDAIERFRTADPALEKIYELEYVVANYSYPELLSIESFLKRNEITFHQLKRNNSDVFVVIKMKLNSKKIIEIESYLTFFANEHDFKYDGWGALE